MAVDFRPNELNRRKRLPKPPLLLLLGSWPEGGTRPFVLGGRGWAVTGLGADLSVVGGLAGTAAVAGGGGTKETVLPAG